MNDKIAKMYQEAHELLTKAKDLLASDGQLTDKQTEQINAWRTQAEEIEKRAKALDALLTQEAALAEQKAKGDTEREQKAREEQQRAAGFTKGWEFLKAVYDFYNHGHIDARLEKLRAKALSGEVGSSGGFLLATQTEQQILTARAEASIIRPRARVVPMGSRVVPFPKISTSSGAAGKSGFFGGVQVYHGTDNTSMTASQPAFGEVELHARDIYGYCEVPNQLIRDSAVSLEAFLSGPGSFGGAVAWQEDWDFIRGDGVGKPLGMLNAACALSVTRNAATDFKLVDAVTMVSKMIMSGGTPLWLINQSVIPKLFQMTNGTYPVWIINAAGSAPTSLLGYDIRFTEKLPALGTAGDVMLVDASMYLLGDRQQITMDVDRSYKFQANATAFRAVESIDGLPWLDGAITLADGATSVSPFVYLN